MVNILTSSAPLIPLSKAASLLRVCDTASVSSVVEKEVKSDVSPLERTALNVVEDGTVEL
jgi:hypothetical protein